MEGFSKATAVGSNPTDMVLTMVLVDALITKPMRRGLLIFGVTLLIIGLIFSVEGTVEVD